MKKGFNNTLKESSKIKNSRQALKKAKEKASEEKDFSANDNLTLNDETSKCQQEAKKVKAITAKNNSKFPNVEKAPSDNKSVKHKKDNKSPKKKNSWLSSGRSRKQEQAMREFEDSNEEIVEPKIRAKKANQAKQIRDSKKGKDKVKQDRKSEERRKGSLRPNQNKQPANSSSRVRPTQTRTLVNERKFECYNYLTKESLTEVDVKDLAYLKWMMEYSPAVVVPIVDVQPSSLKEQVDDFVNSYNYANLEDLVESEELVESVEDEFEVEPEVDVEVKEEIKPVQSNKRNQAIKRTQPVRKDVNEEVPTSHRRKVNPRKSSKPIGCGSNPWRNELEKDSSKGVEII